MSTSAVFFIHSQSLTRELAPLLAQADDTTLGERLATGLLADALHSRATDIHCDPLGRQVRVRFRVDGVMFDVVTLPEAMGQRMVRYFKTRAELDPVTALLPVNSHARFIVGEKPVDLRVACAPCVTGECMAIRILQGARAALPLVELGLTEDQSEWIRRWLEDLNGMLLVAGPTGSGKTTTLHALLAEMQLLRHSVITVEDPVEYQVAGVNQMEVNAKHGFTFAEGLRAALRLDPDYILVGEIRDPESAEVALEAASTGHVLLSTVHSRDAAGAVTMLRNLGLSCRDLAPALAFVLAQRLVRKLCGHCRRQEAPSAADARWLKAIGQPVPTEVWHAPGCEACEGDGYTGRTGVFEVWPVDERSYDLILADADEHALREHLRGSGVRSLLLNGLDKAAQGITDLAEVRAMGVRSYLEGASTRQG